MKGSRGLPSSFRFPIWMTHARPSGQSVSHCGCALLTVLGAVGGVEVGVDGAGVGAGVVGGGSVDGATGAGAGAVGWGVGDCFCSPQGPPSQARPLAAGGEAMAGAGGVTQARVNSVSRAGQVRPARLGSRCDTATVHVWVVALISVYSIRSRIFTLPPGWVRVTRKASRSNALPPSGLAPRTRMTSSMPSPLKSPKAH